MTDPQPLIPHPSSCPHSCYACLFRPSVAPTAIAEAESLRSRPRDSEAVSLVNIAHEFSPRYERHRDDLVSIDVRGLERLLGTPRTIAHELRREAADRGVRVHVAIAGTQTAALVLALARPGITVIDPGEESAALAAIPIGILEQLSTGTPEPESLRSRPRESEAGPARGGGAPREVKNVEVFRRWGLKTLGELAALPAADLAARLGRQGVAWQAIARGEDLRPLVPEIPEERFESSLELEWPIEDLEPLSFVLTRLLEPLATRLERRDRGAAVLHVQLRLVTKEMHARRLELPTPMRDVRTLRTLALLDLESHPPAAAIDRVTIVIDPTPGRVLQHTLFTRSHPTPEQLSTLLARLGALMGQDRIGAPATVDSYRPGAFEMKPFATEHHSLSRVGPHPHALAELRSRSASRVDSRPRQKAEDTFQGVRRPVLDTREGYGTSASASGGGAPREIKDVVSALRRCRQPVSARVAVADGRPVRVTTDRRSFTGGTVLASAGPWRTSGFWWAGEAGGVGPAATPEAESLRSRPRTSEAVPGVGVGPLRRPVLDTREGNGPSASGMGVGPHANKEWNRDEWDVSLSDGAVYRIFQDRETGGWFIDAIVD